MDDQIAEFSAITSADPQRAQQYLSLTDGILEQAIHLYFDSGGVDMGAAVPQPSAPSQLAASASAARPSYRENEDGTVTIDSDDEMDDVQPAQDTGSAYEDDEAMARRLQEEAYGAGRPEEVRAPMARTTETLVGSGSGWRGGAMDDEDDMRAAVAEQMAARQRRGKSLPTSVSDSILILWQPPDVLAYSISDQQLSGTKTQIQRVEEQTWRARLEELQKLLRNQIFSLNYSDRPWI